jgi:hypothetical protein
LHLPFSYVQPDGYPQSQSGWVFNFLFPMRLSRRKRKQKGRHWTLSFKLSCHHINRSVIKCKSFEKMFSVQFRVCPHREHAQDVDYRPYRIYSLVNTISSLISFIFRFQGSSFDFSKLMSFLLMSSCTSFHLYLLFVFIVALAPIHQTTPELLPQLDVTLHPRRIPIAGLFTILWYYPVPDDSA